MAQTIFRGTYTALVTPFLADGHIDFAAWERLVAAQVAGGVEGVVPCGTTGESPALTESEQEELIARAVRVAAGRIQVVAGAGSNATATAVSLVRAAERAGADGVMVVAPYYNKPTPAGMLVHYTQVAAATALPVIVYNVPGRTGSDIGTETLARIADACLNVTAVKEATGNVLRAQDIRVALGDRLTVLCGDDALTLAMAAVGASGVISVTSNLLPRAVSETTRASQAGEFWRAWELHRKLVPVHDLMFVESNPGPVKAAMAARGDFGEFLRAPMVPVSDATRERVLGALRAGSWL